MKRTPLRRKTPLKARPKPGPTKPRPKLAQASAKQAGRKLMPSRKLPQEAPQPAAEMLAKANRVEV